jgi:hypothetical protein
LVKVQFASPVGSPLFIEQWWNGKANFATGGSLAVNAEVFGVDAALVPG